MIQITKMAGVRSRLRGDESTRKSLKGWLWSAFAIFAIFLTPTLSQAAPLSYKGSTPENNSAIESFDDITLHFDIDDIIAEYGSGDWGICCSAYYNKRKPETAQCATLYKGLPEDGEVIERLTTTIDTNEEAFMLGGDFHISFTGVPVEVNQTYTLVITYDMYAGRRNIDDPWLVDTQLNLLDNPITLTFIGGSDVAHVLNIESTDLDSSQEYEFLPELTIDFNYPVSITQTARVELVENESVLATADKITIDPDNENTIRISFPETSLYKGHSYQIVVAPESVCIEGEEDVTNNELSFIIKGASYRYFGVGRVRPSDGSETVMDEITIPFKFPMADDKTYGFVNVDNGNKKWYLHIYEGSTADGEEILSVAATRIGDDNQSLIFRPEYAFKPETEYTLVIPEGDVLA
ncbi:MAG: hypothetical protein K2H96_07125, partial [Muribaculaceae bacterium]|nr:hypothetical protein [Muribaculaceae bacterium]